MPRYVKWTLAGLAGLILILALAAGAGWYALKQGLIRDWSLARIESKLYESSGLQLEYKDAQGDFLNGTELAEVSLSWQGSPILQARKLIIEHNLLHFKPSQISLSRLELVSPVMNLQPLLDFEKHKQEPKPSSAGQGWSIPFESLLIKELILKDWLFNPGPVTYPLTKVRGKYAQARVEWDQKGLRFQASRVDATNWLDVLDRPVNIQEASALVTPRGFTGLKGVLECGGNKIRATGSMGWSGGTWFSLAGKGVFHTYDRLPLNWFWPKPPDSPLGLEIKMGGRLPRLEFSGKLKLKNRVHQAAVTLDFRKRGGEVRFAANDLHPADWGLITEPVSLSGKIRAELVGLNRSIRVISHAELDQVRHPEHGRGTARLDFTWPDRLLDIHESRLRTSWADLQLSGSASLNQAYLPQQFDLVAGFSNLRDAGRLAEFLPAYLNKMSLNGTLKTRGDMERQELQLRLEESTMRPGVEFNNLSMKGFLQEKQLTIRSLEAEGSWGRVRGSGKIGQQDCELDYQLVSTNPSGLRSAMKASGINIPPIGFSQIQADIRLGGDWKQPDLLFNALGQDMSAFGFSAGNLELSAEIKSMYQEPWGRAMLRAQEVDAAQGSSQGTRLEIVVDRNGGLRLTGQLMEMSSKWAQIGRLGLKVKLDNFRSAAKGTLELLGSKAKALGRNWSGLELKGELAPGSNLFQVSAQSPGLNLSADLFTRDPAGDWREFEVQGLKAAMSGLENWVQKDLARISQTDSGWRLEKLNMVHNGESAALDAELSGDMVSAGLTIGGIRMSRLLPQDPFVKGSRMDIQADLSGSLTEPRLTAQGSLKEIAWTGRSQARFNWRAEYEHGNGLSFEGHLSEAGQARTDLTGRIAGRLELWPPRWLEAEKDSLDLVLKGEKLPLRATAPVMEGVKILAGLVNGQMGLRGTTQKPIMGGWAKLAGGKLEIPGNRQILDQINAELEFSGSDVNIKNFNLKSGGTLKGFGRLGLPWLGSDEIRLDLDLDEFALSLPDLGNASLAAFFSCQGTWQAPEIKGWIRPGQLNVDIGLTPPSALDDVVILKNGQKPPPVGQARKPLIWNPEGFLGKSLMDLEVRLPQNKKVNAGPGWLILEGGLNLKKMPHQPMTYHNRVKVLDGLYVFRGKSFQNAKGEIDFKGSYEPNPLLNLRAVHQAGTVLIFVNVSGPARDPLLQLTSQPPMSKADILSTMVFGRTRSQLSSQEDRQLAAQALALVGMGSTKAMQDVLGPGLSPDVFSVHTELGHRGSFLEAGKYLDQNIYLHYRENMGPDSSRNVGLELKLTDWFSIDSQYGTAQDTGVDLILNFDF